MLRPPSACRGPSIHSLFPVVNRDWILPGKFAGRILRGRCAVSLLHRPSGAGALDFSTDETTELEAELARLRQEHRDLDTAIEALDRMVAGDQLQIQRLKKR